MFKCQSADFLQNKSRDYVQHDYIVNDRVTAVSGCQGDEMAIILLFRPMRSAAGGSVAEDSIFKRHYDKSSVQILLARQL